MSTWNFQEVIKHPYKYRIPKSNSDIVPIELTDPSVGLVKQCPSVAMKGGATFFVLFPSFGSFSYWEKVHRPHSACIGQKRLPEEEIPELET